MSAEPTTETTPNPIKPTFEEWMDARVIERNPETHQMVRSNVLYYALKAHMDIMRTHLNNMAEKDSNMFQEDSKEFQEKQKEWHTIYMQIIQTRTYCMYTYGLPMVQKGEIMSERDYLGVLLSEEDFKKYMTTPPEGFEVMKKENIDEGLKLDKSIHGPQDKEEVEGESDEEGGDTDRPEVDQD